MHYGTHRASTQRVLWCAGLLAGGTGLTPMIRLIHTILSNLEDRVKVRSLLQRLMLDPLLQLRTFWVTRAQVSCSLNAVGDTCTG